MAATAPVPKHSKAVLLSLLLLFLSTCDARHELHTHARKLASQCPELTIEATGESVCNTAIVPGTPNSTFVRFTVRTTANPGPTVTYSVTQGVVCPSSLSGGGSQSLTGRE